MKDIDIKVHNDCRIVVRPIDDKYIKYYLLTDDIAKNGEYALTATGQVKKVDLDVPTLWEYGCCKVIGTSDKLLAEAYGLKFIGVNHQQSDSISNYFLPKYLSILLKESGFDLNCMAIYTDDGVLTSGERKGFHKKHHFYKDYAAITWEQAFDWFESKHEIFISCNYAAPDTNAFSYRIDDYTPRYKSKTFVMVDGKLELQDTGKMVGHYAITPTDKNNNHVTYETRWMCYEQAILHALNRL